MEKNLKHKVDIFLWAVMWLLPFLAFFVSWYRVGSAPPIFTFIDEQFSFPFIQDIINGIWVKAFGSTLQMSGLISYLVCVEIAHCVFDALVFMPRVAHQIVEGGSKLWQRG